MRLKGALQTDIKFQFKQGIYAIYVLVTVFYIVAVKALPTSIHKIIVPFIVFSDPSVVGFFFIGGVIMLEKAQGVLTYLTITPLRLSEYILSKIIAYTLLAEVAGFAITLLTYDGPVNWFLLFIGIFLTSIFFTLLGLLAASNCKTMNQYFLRMVPYMLFGIIPCFGMIPSSYTFLLHFFPGLTALELVYGAFHSLAIGKVIAYGIYTLLMDLLLYLITYKVFQRETSF
ncbi:fluoroquinolone export ABC transporter permease subunit [Vallitalea okinawensis]|uniref:fluoroquinolone export ABC transporter permease subunit n=1 Tax=Vallitalea okinawensis TaxID=2078660 RepID=UPI000CFB8388|nr:ABC transporter permease [Vallitalea okinawensis]